MTSTAAKIEAKIDTLIRYLHDPRNEDTAREFHQVANDVLGIRRDVDEGDDVADDDEDADEGSSPRDGAPGGKDDAARSAAASSTAKKSTTAKK